MKLNQHVVLVAVAAIVVVLMMISSVTLLSSSTAPPSTKTDQPDGRPAAVPPIDDDPPVDTKKTHAADESRAANAAVSFEKVAACMKREAKDHGVVAVGSNPIGTYICDYFLDAPGAVHDSGSKKSCTIRCPLRLPSTHRESDEHHEHDESEPAQQQQQQQGEHFSCRIQEKASVAVAKSPTAWDLMLFHYGKPPVAPDPSRQLVVFYSGESNFTEAKRARPEYQRLFHHVVSCHHTRRFSFTWTARFRRDFLAIAKRDAAKSQTDLRKEWHSRINAAAIFVSRCGKGGRDKVIEALRTSGIPIHSFGKCQRTHTVAATHPECRSGGDAGGGGDNKKGVDRYGEKLCVFRKYRYVLALDNSHEEDYVTEKIYHAFITGAVPLYLGAPNVADFVPMPQSLIPLSRWASALSPAAVPDEKQRQQHEAAGMTPFQIDQQIRTAPKAALNLAKMKEDLDSLDRAADPAHEEESAAVYWLDSLLDWRRAAGADNTPPTKKWSKAFWRNLNKREPTCDLCNLALQRRCQPNA